MEGRAGGREAGGEVKWGQECWDSAKRGQCLLYYAPRSIGFHVVVELVVCMAGSQVHGLEAQEGGGSAGVREVSSVHGLEASLLVAEAP